MSDNVIFDGSNDHDVADTSKETYKDLIGSGELGDQCKAVLKALNGMGLASCTINELAKETLAGWEKSTISGRLNDLRDHDLVVKAGKRDDKYSGRKSHTNMITDKGKKYLEEIKSE
ncbi:hypothetical protein OSG_eHP35_00025 [environmental Halophage eHP-35]|nr:hypothetical protein OSG_eHP35_00025 [environmental Halophage eHP-35]